MMIVFVILICFNSLLVSSESNYLPFLYPTDYLIIDGYNDHAENVSLPSLIRFGSSCYSDAWISANGLISLGTRYTSYYPSLFPIATPVIAPYWDDNDLSYGRGEVRYAVVTPATNLSLCNQVNDYLSTSTGSSVSVEWILWAYWYDVCPFFNNCNNIQSNHFQVVSAFQSNATYAVFIYKCGLIRSTRYRAGVGINSGDGYYINHPLSNTDGVTDIDCYDEISGWSNVVYRLDQEIGTNSQPSDTSRSSHNSLIIDIYFGLSVFAILVLLLAVVVLLRIKCRKRPALRDPKEDIPVETEVNLAYEMTQRRSNQIEVIPEIETINEIQVSQNCSYADATNIDDTHISPIYDDILQEIPPEPESTAPNDDQSVTSYEIP